MTKNIVIVILAIAVISLVYYVSNRKCFYLPTSGTTDEWGFWYWKSFHDIAERIPCNECKEKGSSFLVYMHDLVNLKTKKQIFDPKNFAFWTSYIKGIPTTTESTTTSTSTTT